MLYFAFRRASSAPLYDKWVDRFSGGKGFSHVELVFSDGMCFSARPGSGCSFQKTDVNDRRQWEKIRLPLDAKKELSIRLHCTRFVGDRYDWLGVVRFALRVFYLSSSLKVSRQHRFCSEICLQMVQWGGLFKWAALMQTSPNDLYLMARGYASAPV